METLPSSSEFEAMLLSEFSGIELSDSERCTISWLADCDYRTVLNLLSMLRRLSASRKFDSKAFLLVWRGSSGAVCSCRFDDFSSLEGFYRLFKSLGFSCFWKEVS